LKTPDTYPTENTRQISDGNNPVPGLARPVVLLHFVRGHSRHAAFLDLALVCLNRRVRVAYQRLFVVAQGVLGLAQELQLDGVLEQYRDFCIDFSDSFCIDFLDFLNNYNYPNNFIDFYRLSL
jgi:hypothetical protein